MAKITLSDLASLSNEATVISTINSNNALIEAAIENTLSRDGTSPNTMSAILDVNSYRIINVPTPVSSSDAVPKNYVDALAIDVTAQVAAAAASATAAAASESNAATSETNAAASATAAATSATNAATSETNAATSETNAAASATAASTAQTAAEVAQAAAEAASENPALTYQFSSSTADSDPTAGYFRFNNASPASATEIYIDGTDYLSNSVVNWIDAWDDVGTSGSRGTIIIRGVTNKTAFFIGTVTGSIVDGSGYRKVSVTRISSAGTFTADDVCSVLFINGAASGIGAGTVTAETLAEDATTIAKIQGLAYNPKSASELLGFDDGIALEFRSQSFAIADKTLALSDAGHSTNIATFTRNATASYRDVDGLLKYVAINTPRYHHNADGTPRGYLNETRRDNVLLHSEDFTNAAWTKTRTNATANAAVAPDGTTTADKIYDDSTAAASHVVVQAEATIDRTAPTTGSMFVKAAEYSQFQLRMFGATSSDRVDASFDLTTGTISSAATAFGATTDVSAAIEEWLDGWYRVSVTATLAASGTGASLQLHLNNGSGLTYNGDGSSGLYVWGAQLEQGGHASSYIPTTTVAVTRWHDNFQVTPALVPIDADNVTIIIVMQLDHIDTSITTVPLCIFGAGLSTDSVSFRITAGASLLNLNIYSSSALQALISVGTPIVDTRTIAAVSAKKDSVLASSSLADGTPDTSATMPTALNTRIGIGSNATSNPMNGTIESVVILNRALTADEIAQLMYRI